MGNPRVATTIYLEPDVAAALHAYAYESQSSKRAVIDNALRKYLPARLLKAPKQ